MTELLTAAQMRAIEQAAIESGSVTGLELMERAGRGVVEAVFEEWPELAKAPHRAVVLCGAARATMAATGVTSATIFSDSARAEKALSERIRQISRCFIVEFQLLVAGRDATKRNVITLQYGNLWNASSGCEKYFSYP